MNMTYDVPVIELEDEARATFIRRTYGHVAGAITAFTLLEIYFFSSGMAQTILESMARINWLIVMALFIGVSWVANNMAARAMSLPMQYLGLGIYVVVEAIIFVPMLWIAEASAPGVIQNAALVTLLGFSALTAVVFVTAKDFSFLRGAISVGFILALGAIIASAIFGFKLGILFDVAMVALACGSILYNTSGVMHHYPEDRYVSASLSLFANVALLFWYVLRIFMRRD